MDAFRVIQDGTVRVRVKGANSESSALNYAMSYRHIGDVTIQHNAKGYWKRYAFLCQWPPIKKAKT